MPLEVTQLQHAHHARTFRIHLRGFLRYQHSNGGIGMHSQLWRRPRRSRAPAWAGDAPEPVARLAAAAGAGAANPVGRAGVPGLVSAVRGPEVSK